VGQKDEQLFKALAKMAERRLDEFNAQNLANTAWAFANAGQSDEKLFVELARAAEQRLSDLTELGLTNVACAFAMAGSPVPALLHPISVLDVMEAQGSKPQLISDAVSM